ncbi:putative quinol monooxygenase [Vibrio lentus]|uniref:putative quinol monooxygenase n=1 Tax=Vibrio lentus TaxID=136468 RepID=UPI0009FA3D8E|nr:antibiotic biosynthesis monooxygenase family protein [Vibrio lentus]
MMTILVQFTLSHTEDKTAEIVEFFNEILPDTCTFNGNLSAELYQKDLSENSLALFEEWESTAHFNEYIAWRKNIGDFDRLGAMLTDMPAITVMSKIVTTPEVE